MDLRAVIRMKDGGARIDSEGNDADKRDGNSMGAMCNSVDGDRLEGCKAANEPAAARFNRGEHCWIGRKQGCK